MTIRRRKHFTKAERNRIARNDFWTCRYCGGFVWFFQDADVAHEKAFSHGGSDDLRNLAWSHSHCNRSAGNKDMKMIQRLSLRSWLLLILVVLFGLLVFGTCSAEASDTDPMADNIASQPHSWKTKQEVQRTFTGRAINKKLNAAYKCRCPLAIADFTNAKYHYTNRNYKSSAKWVRLGNKHLTQRGCLK